ncbi:nucleoside-binding protein [Longilinea arvoryzae]|uniref:Nucleoside-binding protein n=1 Tax=Longilinea arvoryzae TaxID=360412 RepID=A0A0S7BG26_9CHLR|nr:BMP family ABC transporter substrate-binding protein [Longilinea arvoryzae]GAP14032.1 nucleoside-binding protein [Longilinea arvoryzae]
MAKKLSLVLAVVVMATMILAACAPAATPTAAPVEPTAAPVEPTTAPVEPTVAPTEAPAAKIKVCEVTDTGGIDDKSFNATAWKGVTDAVETLGIEGKYLESQEVADYEKNINAFVEEKCDLIIPVGFYLTDATKAAAEANPDVKFSIVDVSYDPIIPNILGQVFQTDQAAFLAGYLAAGVTKTGKVGTFGGFPIPTVTIFMDGFARGVAYYNEQKGTKVEVLGWDINDPEKGLFSSSFDDQAKGKELGNSLMDEGADIIMPVAGPVGLGTAAAVKERGNAYIIGVDSDWALTNPEYADIVLTSVMKLMDATVLDSIKMVIDGTFKGGITVGTLTNKGVGLGTINAAVPEALRTETEALAPSIIDGTIKLSDTFAIKQ